MVHGRKWRLKEVLHLAGRGLRWMSGLQVDGGGGRKCLKQAVGGGWKKIQELADGG